MNSIRTIGITTGGGDCPGLNAVIRAVYLTATAHGITVIGIPDGLAGLMNADGDLTSCRALTLADVRAILPRGGTILGTTNRQNPFACSMLENGQKVVRDVSDRVIENARRLGLDCMLIVGGDGTQRIGLKRGAGHGGSAIGRARPSGLGVCRAGSGNDQESGEEGTIHHLSTPCTKRPCGRSSS